MAGSVGSEDGDMGFQIAPMVDVVFVLLLFFMASTGSKVMENVLYINLPSGTCTPTPATPRPHSLPPLLMAGSVGSEDGDMGFQIAPMVDVVFVLMLFLMAITGFKAKEYMLHANLPSPPGAGARVTGVIRIDITEA